ncbi:MAG: hypothetical protein INR62_13820, partial [Rhodospirillales bacterium]|nr:hypothetical protein [Acetobacter sp.]
MNHQNPPSFLRGVWMRYTTMSPKHRAVWAMTRTQGRQSYIWRVGVCQYGLFMFLLNSASTYYDYFQRDSGRVHLWFGLLFDAVVAVSLGSLCGKAMWSQFEKQFWAGQGQS